MASLLVVNHHHNLIIRLRTCRGQVLKNLGVQLGDVGPEHQSVHQDQDHPLVMISILVMSHMVIVLTKNGAWLMNNWNAVEWKSEEHVNHTKIKMIMMICWSNENLMRNTTWNVGEWKISRNKKNWLRKKTPEMLGSDKGQQNVSFLPHGDSTARQPCRW